MKLKFPAFSESLTFYLGKQKNLDFYYRNGDAIVAARPMVKQKNPHKLTPKQKKARKVFRDALDWYYHLGPNVIQAYKEMAKGTTKTWKDIYFSQFMSNQFNTDGKANQVLEFRFYGDENDLKVVWWTVKNTETIMFSGEFIIPIAKHRKYRGKYERCHEWHFLIPGEIPFLIADRINIGVKTDWIVPTGVHWHNVTWEGMPLNALLYENSYYSWKYAARDEWRRNLYTAVGDPLFCFHSETVTESYIYNITVRDGAGRIAFPIDQETISKAKAVHISKEADTWDESPLPPGPINRVPSGLDIIMGGNVVKMDFQESSVRLPRRPYRQELPGTLEIWIIPESFKKFSGAFTSVPPPGTHYSWNRHPGRIQIEITFHSYIRHKADLTWQQMHKLMAIGQRFPGYDSFITISPIFKPVNYRGRWRPLSMMEQDHWEPYDIWPNAPWINQPGTQRDIENVAQQEDSDELAPEDLIYQWKGKS